MTGPMDVFAVRVAPAAAHRCRRPLAFWRTTHTDERVHSVEVKIGITDSPRELVFNSAQSPSEVEASINEAFKDPGVLALTDDKGRRFLVQTTRIAYVEIGAADARRVGFGVSAESAKTG